MDELLDNAPCGFLVFTDNGTITHINQTLLNLLDYRLDELTGTHLERLLSAAGRIFYQTHFFPLLKLHGKVEEIYLSLRSRAGEEIPVLANAARHERDGAIFNDCVVVPMHRRNLYEEEILKAKKEAEAATLAKDEFLSIISHELRTPLNAILGWTQILQKNQANEKMLRRAVEVIDHSARSQRVLIEDILDFARITTGKLAIEVEPVNVAKTIESAVEIITPAANAKEIELKTALETDAVVVAGDGNRLQQVFWNLLSNAVKFTPPGGSVSARLERAESSLKVSVKDTGEGIKPDFLPFVFERFRQADTNPAKRHHGVGLGLAITRYIVELHGGTIRAESAGENRGATFTVSLPLMS